MFTQSVVLPSATPAAPATARPLRILQSASCFEGWGGCELHLLNLSEELRKRGHDVTISVIPGKFVEEEAARRGIPTLPLHQRKRYEWSLLPVWRDLIGGQKFDVVHVHGSRDYVIPPFAAKQCRVPAVLMTRHFPKAIRFPQNHLYRAVLFDHVIAVSESVRRVLLQSGFPSEKVSTIYNFTNVEAFSPETATVASAEVRSGWGIAPDDTRSVMGFVGRFVADKGGDIFLEALAEVPEAIGVLVGDGKEKESWQRLAGKLRIEDRVVWAGFRADIQNCMLAFDTFVLPSIYPEPCATVVQQAMAMGRPVIGTQIGGTPEMVREGETGLLVPAGNATALAESLRTVARMGNPQRNAMGRRGRERIREHFALDKLAGRTELLYRKIIAVKGNTP